MAINIKIRNREEFVSELRPMVNNLEPVDEYSKELGLLCSLLITTVSKSNYEQQKRE